MSDVNPAAPAAAPADVEADAGVDVISTINKLKQLATCDVADALRTFSVPHGGFVPGLTMFSPRLRSGSREEEDGDGDGEEEGDETTLVGPVWVVKFVDKDDVDAPRLEGHYIDKTPPHHVLFISAPSPTGTSTTPRLLPNALYGGLMSRRARYLGARGTVVDGRVRDLREHWGLGYTVFARGSGTTAGGEICRPSAINVATTIHSPSHPPIALCPGDWLHGDVDGLVVIPRSLVSKVYDVALRLKEVDEQVAGEIDGGMGVAEAFAKWRQGGKAR